MDFQLNVLDFEKIFNSIDTNETLSVVALTDSNPEHTQFIVIDKSQDEIRLEEVDTHKTTVWKRADFILNKYNILDLIRSQPPDELPEAVFNASFESLEPQFVNFESIYIQKNDYEQIFPIQDQISSIEQYYLSRIENPSNYARTIIQKKAEVLGSFIQNYNQIPKSTDIPILDQINNNHFYSPLLRPIVYDSKYIFKESPMFDTEDVRNYFRDEEDKLIITIVDEITKEYAKKNDKKMTYIEFQNVLIYGGDLPFAIRVGDKSNIMHVGPLMNSYLPMNQVPHQKAAAASAAEGAGEGEGASAASADALEKIKKVAGFSLNVSDFTDVYRFITPSYPFGPADKIQTSIRRTQGSKIILYDRPDNTEIGTNSGSRECFGTAGTSESKYYSKADRYVPKSSDNIYNAFNKCISKEPNEIRATDGEEVFIVGMFVKSPFSITPPNNILYKKKNSSLLPVDYFIENRNGWWNVIDRVIQSRSVHRKNKLNEITANEKPDYTKDNIVLFEKESIIKKLSLEEFQEKLKQIIPSTQQILQIEEKSLTDINNITDLNKILSKYFLSHKNLNIKQMTEIELFLRNSYYNLKKNIEQEKMDETYYTDLNIYCQQLFNGVYESICRFQNQRNLDEQDVINLIESYFKSFNIQHLSHILRFYYGLESGYLDKTKALSIFVHLFSKRYTDYMQSESPVRLLLLPNFYIQDVIIQKYTDFIRRYYNFDIMSHAPSSIGLINELYNRMFIKDSSSNFNFFADFVYATNGYNKIVQDEQDLISTYKNKEIVQQQIAELTNTILQEKIAFQIQQTVCSKYQLSKFYSSVIDLMKDNNKSDVLVDKIFDKTATLNSIFMLHGNDSIPFIKEAYPHEPEDWYGVILEMLIEKGKLNGALVEDTMWALLVEGDRYDLYQRQNTVWEYRMTVPELARVEVPYNKKTKQFSPPKNIAALCNFEGRDASVVEKIADFLYFGLKEELDQPAQNEKNLRGKCVAYENACLPRIVMQLNKKLVELKSILKAFTYYDKQKQIYASTAFDLRQKMEVLLNRFESNEQSKIANTIERSSAGPILSEPEAVNSVYQIYKKQWDLIVQISEIDVRFDEINKFIQLHGLLEKRIDPLLNSLADATNDGEWTHVYYDHMEKPEILCCRHYLVLVKQAWQGNEVRFKLQESLENLFRSDTSDEAAIFCKYCGESIGYTKESEFEGFDDNEHVIRLREAVYEQSDDNLKMLFTDVQAEMYDKILVELMQTLQFKLKTQDITDVIRNATDVYFKSKLDIYQFEFKFVYPQMMKTKTDSPYRKLRDVISTGELKSVNFIDLQHTEFKALFDKEIPKVYNRYVAKLMVDTVMFQLMVHMLIMDPEIKMYPTGSRFSECRISVINNFILNPTAFFTMFAQVISCIANAANKPDDIFFVYKSYYGSGGIAKEKIKDEFEKKFNELIDTDADYVRNFLAKKEKYEKQLEQTKQLVLDSAVWKSFRPILKLGNPDTELSKINLASIDSTISDLTVLSDVEVQYKAFQLSNYLFYSIQKVIQEKTSLMVGQSFSNYCCLEPLRTHYLEYFIRQEPRIQECIELMRRLEPRSFYNPNQSSWLICAGNGPNDILIENTCPPLLDYFEEARRELNPTQLKQRILKLFQTYRLEDGVVAESGQRRLYSQYYDEYLAMVQVASPEEIKQTIQRDHPEMDETDVEQRVQNLYALIDPGLIRKDVETDQYSWTIAKLANDLIAANDQDLLGLYDNLVLKLNQSSKLKISQHPYAPLTLQSSYADDSELKTENFKELKLTFNKLVGAIHECGGDELFAEILQLNEDLQKELVADDDKINDIFEIIAHARFTKIEMQNPTVYFDFKEDLGNCTAIMEEKRRNLASYIQIEGYADEQIDEQKNIRDAILNKEDEFKILENLKQYYLFVIESISKFVNYRLNELTYGNGKIIFSANRHKELSENVNQSRVMNFKFNTQKFIDYVAITQEYKRLTVSQLQNMNKFIPIEYVQNLFMIIGDDAEILNPQYLKIIIYYLLHKTLTNFINSVDEHRGFVSNYVQIFIINELKSISRFNCLSEKQVKTHLRDIIKKQNARRKKKVDDINKDESMRIQYNLIRSFGLGNVLEMKDTEEIAMVLNDVADAGEVVENVQQGDEGGAPDDISAGGMVADAGADQLQMGTKINRDTDEEGNADAMGDEGCNYGD